MLVRLRESTDEDFGFVFNLNKINMRNYVEKLRGWDEEAERMDMQSKFNAGLDKIIQVDGQDAGVFRIIKKDDQWKIDHIELLPQFQNKGIGTRLITELLKQAKDEGKRVWLRVLRTNPALQLYERLGFKKTGENELKYIMTAE